MTTTRVNRRPHRTALAATLMSALLVLTACGGSEDQGGDTGSDATRSFEADNGIIEIPTDPQRIIGIQRGASNLLAYGMDPVGIGQFNEDPAWLSPEQRAVYDETPTWQTGIRSTTRKWRVSSRIS